MLSHPVIYATCPTHLALFHLLIQIILVRSTNCEAPHYAVFFCQPPTFLSILGASIILSIQFLEICNLCSDLNIKD